MLVKKFRFNRGDTLIEALFAITIFSLVAVGGLSIMNQGLATAQRSLEITLVRNAIDSQAEALRFLNSSYIASYKTGVSGCSPEITLSGPARQWQIMQCDILTTNNSQASDFGIGSVGSCPVAPNGSFVINTNAVSFVRAASGKLKPAVVFSQLDYSGGVFNQAEGIWIEAVRSQTVLGNNQASAGYIDFHIRACWDSPGQSIPVTIGTIVRLYEPRG